jgi:hypothetical protein
MKKCPYCGAEYSNEALVCRVDQQGLIPSESDPGPVKQHIERPFPSRSSQIVNGFAGVSFLAICIFAAVWLIDDLKTGKTFSPAIIVGERTLVDRASSPRAFWVDTGLYLSGACVGMIVSVSVLFEVLAQHKRKATALRKRTSTT